MMILSGCRMKLFVPVLFAVGVCVLSHRPAAAMEPYSEWLSFDQVVPGSIMPPFAIGIGCEAPTNNKGNLYRTRERIFINESSFRQLFSLINQNNVSKDRAVFSVTYYNTHMRNTKIAMIAGGIFVKSNSIIDLAVNSERKNGWECG